MSCSTCGNNYHIGNAVKDLVTANLKFASVETQANRKLLCNLCPHKVMNVCTQCGCVIFMKIRLKPSGCPLGKW